MKDRKRKVELFSFYDHTGMERRLEKMAQKGWLLEKIGSFGWIYRRTEPKKLRFTVSFYPKASLYDPEPSEGQRTFRDFCRHTGWIPVEAAGPMQVFCNEAENPIPIETDPELEVENLHRAVKKSYVMSYWMLLAIGILELAMMAAILAGDPIQFLASSSYLMGTFDWLMVILMSIAELIGYYSWRSRARRAAQDGVFLPSRGTAGLQKTCLALVLGAFAIWLVRVMTTAPMLLRVTSGAMLAYVTLMYLAVHGVMNLMKKRKASAGWNKAATWGTSILMGILMMVLVVFGVLKADRAGVFDKNTEKYEYKGRSYTAYHDQLPLTLEDLTGAEWEGYSSRKTGDGSFLLERYSMNQEPRFGAENWADLPALGYTVIRTKADFLYDCCLSSRMDKIHDPQSGLHTQPTDPAPWGAEKACRIVGDDRAWHYLLCYKSTIVQLVMDWDPTPEQMAMVGEKLGK